MKPNSPSSGQDHLGTGLINLMERLPATAGSCADHRPSLTRRQWFRRAADFSLVASIAGCRPASNAESSNTEGARFRVRGASMAPTLYGEHLRVHCPHCAVDFRVCLPDSRKRPVEFQCWHCGAMIASRHCPTLPGDLIEVDPPGRAGLRTHRGGVVALKVDGKLRVKRILAGPGDEVDVDGLQLLANSQSPLPSAEQPVLPVDLDERRSESRWSGRGWKRRRRRWQHDGSRQWLIYTHRSVHDHGRISRVWDDYPCNIGLARKLQPVDRLRLTMNVDAEETVEIEFAIWSPSGVGRIRTRTMGGPVAASSRQALASEWLRPEVAAQVPVGEASPLALRVTRGFCTINNIQISRPLDYRLRPRDDRTGYPLVLAADQYFLVGDNIPVSIDSRQWGPVNADQFLGTVSKRSGS